MGRQSQTEKQFSHDVINIYFEIHICNYCFFCFLFLIASNFEIMIDTEDTFQT